MCQKCQPFEMDINQFIKGYGEVYPPQAVEELYKIRQELCNLRVNCSCEQCFADKLIDIIDNNPEIKRKKGLQ